MNISFSNLRFDFFSIIAKEVSQVSSNVVCTVARLVFVFYCALTTDRCNAFQHIFRKLKEIRVLRPIFPDYVISCDYDHGHCNAEPTIIRRVLRENLENNCHRDLDDKPENTKKDSY